MAEFNPVTIETQEQFDELIKDRLARHKTQIETEVKAGYADYEDLKTKATAYETEKSAWETAKADYEKKLTDATTKLTDATGKLTVYETEKLKAKAIKAAGIPAESWEEASKFVKGGTEAELKESAESLKKLLGIPKKTPPRKQSELDGDKKTEGYAGLVNQLTEGA
jgi:predicted  nucleic acid-binding Zn-ribbon protein